MTKSARKLEELFVDIPFAEDRAFSYSQKVPGKVAQTIEDTFTAIAFAEAGEFETAISLINKNGGTPKVWRSEYWFEGFSKPCAGRAS